MAEIGVSLREGQNDVLQREWVVGVRGRAEMLAGLEVDGGTVIFDDEQAVRNFVSGMSKDKVRDWTNDDKRPVMEVAMELWEGVPVNTRERIQRGEEPLDMFYKAPDDIYDVDATQTAAKKAFVGGWEVGRTVMNKSEPFVEAAVMAAIYGFGEGFRGSDGLWVRNFKTDGRYVLISGEWMQKNLFKKFKYGGVELTFENASRAVDEGLPELKRRGLVMPEDFRRKEGIWTIVQYKGLVGLVDDAGVRRRFNLGVENAGKFADRIGDNQYVIYDYTDGVISPESIVNIAGVSEENTKYRGGTLDVPREAVVLTKIRDEKRKEELTELIRFKNVLRRAGRNDVDALSEGQQLVLKGLWKEYGGSEVNLGVVGEVIKSFDYINKWLDYWGQWTGNGRQGVVRRIFLNRVGQAFRSHMESLAGKMIDNETVWDELVLANEMLDVLNKCVRGEDGWKMRQDSQYPKMQVGGKEGDTKLVEDVMIAFNNPDYPDRQLNIVVRPTEREFRGTQREACLRINYVGGGEQVMSIRIDLSMERVSLDFDVLKHLGLSHHQEAGFDEALSDPIFFKEMGSFFARVLGVENLEEVSGGKKLRWAA